MGIEKLATSAVESSIEKTDRLSSFINSGDKEPCWDGNIYIHEGKNHTKKNIKKVATQVKGKKVKPHQVLLSAARQMCEWIQGYPQFVSKEITALNRLQIIRRERDLSITEKAELFNIVGEVKDNFIRLGALLLLGEQAEAKKILEELPQEDRDKFKDYPIYKFYKPIEA